MMRVRREFTVYAYAASVLAMLPVIAFFLLAQRQLTRGLLAGAVKG